MFTIPYLQKKHLGKGKSAPKVEMGTRNTDVDYSWLPQETLQEMSTLGVIL